MANVDVDGFSNNRHLDIIGQIAAKENAEVIAICNQLEAEIAELDDEARADFIADMGMQEAGLDRVLELLLIY